MNEIKKSIWTQIFKDSFKIRFGSLSENEMNKKIDFAVQNYTKISAEKLFRNLVFCTVSEIFSFTLDYADKFINNFDIIFLNPISREIDENEYLTSIEKESINCIIKEQMIIINHQVENIMNKKKLTKNETKLEIAHIFKHEEFPVCKLYWYKIDYINFLLSPEEICFASLFLINPKNKKSIKQINQEESESNFSFQFHCLKLLKKYYSWERILELIETRPNVC